MKDSFECLIQLLKPFIILGEIQIKSSANLMIFKITLSNLIHGSDSLCFLFTPPHHNNITNQSELVAAVCIGSVMHEMLFHFHLFILYGKWQLPLGLEFLSSAYFYRLSFSNCLNCIHGCDGVVMCKCSQRCPLDKTAR